MTWVKICGTTNLKDALLAVDAGADAVGFVFYEKSPRNISVEAARAIVGKLPGKIEKVGVFVGPELGATAEASRKAGLTVAQIYPRGDSLAFTGESLAQLPCRVIAALSVGVIDGGETSGFYISDDVGDRVLAMLIDSGNSERPGGTGERFDWTRNAEMEAHFGLPLIVAGGLTPENVAEAIKTMKPWGVDVASGVEAQPGKKDPEKVRAFIRAVREADQKTS